MAHLPEREYDKPEYDEYFTFDLRSMKRVPKDNAPQWLKDQWKEDNDYLDELDGRKVRWREEED